MPTQNLPSIGIHMNGNTIDFAVIQGCNIMVRADSMLCADYSSPNDIIQEIGSRLLALKNVFPAVQAIGMGLTGFVDSSSGTVHSLTNAPGWNDIPIQRILTEIASLPAYVANDAHCAAYAEWKLGAGKGYEDLIYLSLGQGIGSGIVSGGHFLQGHRGAAGEIGQSSIDYSGRIGHYGNRGAIENYIGTYTLARDARSAYAAAGIGRNECDCSPQALKQAALCNCPIALQIWDDLAQKLSTCLVNCCYMLNPEVIILGGELAQAGDTLLSPLRKHLRAQMFYTHYENLQIIPAEFDMEAGLIGAAWLSLHKIDN